MRWLRRVFRILKWTVAVLVMLALVFVFGVAPYLLARLITNAGTRPMDRTLTSSPKDAGLAYEDVSFRAADGTELRGWYLGGGSRGVSISCAHGLFRSRREVLDRAVFLREAGYNVLLFDSRRHGESGGERVTLGYKERLDVEAALGALRERAPGDGLATFGVSMGAAASLLAAAETPNVRAIIADSSFLSIEYAVEHDLKLFFGIPRFPLGDELLFYLSRRGGFRAKDFDIEKAVRDLGERPVLFIAGAADERMPVETQRRLFAASSSPGSQFVVLPGAKHGAGYRTDPATYKRETLGFLAGAFGATP